MIDRERLYTAKLYMDKLAVGMNPIDGQEMGEDAVLNDVNMCRCFVFVSDVLDQLMKNSGSVAKANRRTEKFKITEEQREKIVITENPVGVSTIASRVLKVLDLDVKNIPAVTITMWLEAQGLLTRVIKDGVPHKEATEDGNKMGIETKLMKYGDREYMKTFYDINAQAFIIANLEEIAKFGGGSDGQAKEK